MLPINLNIKIFSANFICRQKVAGFSLFELLIAICVLVILVAIFLQRFIYLQEASEKIAMELTLANMRRGLQSDAANMVIENRRHELPLLLQKNPILWLDTPPHNYIGEIANAEQLEIRPDCWYFDTINRVLVYRHYQGYNRFDYFTNTYSEIRYKVVSRIDFQNQGSDDLKTINNIKLLTITAN